MDDIICIRPCFKSDSLNGKNVLTVKKTESNMTVAVRHGRNLSVRGIPFTVSIGGSFISGKKWLHSVRDISDGF